MVCDEHGASAPTVVCQHLFDHSDGPEQLGFITGFEPEEPRPLAWCRACERVRAREGMWTDEANRYAGWTAVCSNCYERIRTTHLPPP